jgi:PadR family transcriptional regulator, regulatory protein PadR
MADDLALVPGTLDLLVLNTLRWGAKHGYSIARWLRERSGNALALEDRALYLALHRLEERGWIESEWGVSENNRKARYYRLTSPGRRQLQAKSAEWERYASMITSMLRVRTAGERV